MKTRRFFFGCLAIPAAALISFTGSTQTASAADVVKADNTTNLNVVGSWALGAVPGVNDYAVWNSTVTAANTVALGANITWGGIKVIDPGGAVTISTGSTLTLLGGGIDMSAATQNLTINAGVALGTSTLGSFAQNWNVASGRTLTVAAVPGRNSGGSGSNTLANGSIINVTGDGTTKIGTAATAILIDGGTNPFVLYKTNDWAATDATGTVIAASYNNFAAAGAITGSGNVNVTGSGSFTMNGLNVSSMRFANTGGAVVLANSGTSTLRGILLADGAKDVTINSNFIRPNRVGTTSATMSFINNSTAGDLYVGSNISNASSGGVVSLTKAGVGRMIITGSTGYTGFTHILGGVLQIGNGGTTGSLFSTATVSNSGTLAFNRSDTFGFTNQIIGSGGVTQAGAGTLTLSGANTYTGTTNINAGTLAFNASDNLGNGGAISFNGGELSYGTSHTTDISSRTVSVLSGGGKINTNANNVTFSNSIGASGTGGLTKAGTGSLTLNGASYTGTTAITGGSLIVLGNLAGGSSVASGTTLAGTASVLGTTSVASGGIIAPGNGGVGTLTLGSLTLGAGSLLSYDVTSTSSLDQIIVSGSNGLTINGGQLSINGGVGLFTTNGVYNIIGYNGTIGGTGISALTLNASNRDDATKTYSFNTGSGFVTLTVANAAVSASFWNTDADGNWSTAGNWTSAVPNAVSAFAAFGGGGTEITANRTINVDSAFTVGTISLNGAANNKAYTLADGGGSLTFDNGATASALTNTAGNNNIGVGMVLTSNGLVTTVTQLADTLSITGSITGTGAFSKSGAGSLALSGTNSYIGATSVDGGSLLINSDASLGDAANALTINAGALKVSQDITSARLVTLGHSTSSISVDATKTFSLSNVVDGSGALNKNGTGTLVLGGTNTYLGGTSINAGTVSINTDASLGDASGSVVIGNGTLETTASISSARAVSLTNASSTIAVASATTYTLSGAVSGSGTLNKTGAGVLFLSGTSNSFASSVIAGGSITVGGGQFVGNAAFGSGPVTFQGGTLNSNWLGSNDNGSASFGFANNFIVASGQTGTVNMARRGSSTGSLTGAGTFNVNVDGVRDDFAGNWSAFTGQINVGTVATAGDFRINNLSGFGTAKVNLANGVSAYVSNNFGAGGATFNIGELTGGATSSLAGGPTGGRIATFSVGGANTDAEYAGVLKDSAGITAITKTGTGKWTLTGTNTYTGATAVNGGKLVVNGSLGNSSAVTVQNSGSTLGGNGSVGGAVTISSGAILAAGDSATDAGVGALSIGSGATSHSLAAGSIFSWDLNGNVDDTMSSRGIADGYDGLNVTGSLAVSSTAIFRVVLGSGVTTDAFWDTTHTWSDIFSGTVTGGFTNSLIQVVDTLGAVYNQSTLSTNGYGFSISGTTLSWAPVPEPTSALAGLLLGAGLLRRKRTLAR